MILEATGFYSWEVQPSAVCLAETQKPVLLLFLIVILLG